MPQLNMIMGIPSYDVISCDRIEIMMRHEQREGPIQEHFIGVSI